MRFGAPDWIEIGDEKPSFAFVPDDEAYAIPLGAPGWSETYFAPGNL